MSTLIQSFSSVSDKSSFPTSAPSMIISLSPIYRYFWWTNFMTGFLDLNLLDDALIESHCLIKPVSEHQVRIPLSFWSSQQIVPKKNPKRKNWETKSHISPFCDFWIPKCIEIFCLLSVLRLNSFRCFPAVSYIELRFWMKRFQTFLS